MTRQRRSSLWWTMCFNYRLLPYFTMHVTPVGHIPGDVISADYPVPRDTDSVPRWAPSCPSFFYKGFVEMFGRISTRLGEQISAL